MPLISNSLGPVSRPLPSRAPDGTAEARLQLLLEASERLCSAEVEDDSKAILETLGGFLVPSLADACVVSVLNQNGTLEVADFTHSDRMPIAQPYEPRVWAREVALAIRNRGSDLACDRPAAGALDLDTSRIAEDFGIASAMVVPLRYGDRVLGEVALASTRMDGCYDELDFRLVEKLASRAALAIERARLHEFEKRTTDRLRLLQQVTSDLSRAVTLPDVGQIIVTEVVGALAASLATVYLLSATGQTLELLTGSGAAMPPASLRTIELGPSHPLCDAVSSRTPIWIASESDFQDRYPNARRWPGCNAGAACLPLLVDDRVVGALAFGFPSARVLDEADRDFARTLASQCAQALDRARLYSEAEHTIRLRDDFLSLASHELNTPIAALKLALGHLGRGQHSPGTLTRLLGVIERQADRLGHLVSDLLDVSRLTTGVVNLELDDTDIVSVVSDTISRFATASERSGSAISLTAPTSLLGRWDRRRLEQIASCLISNAIKFGRGKPIEIHIEHMDRRARVSVRDRGIGIPKERQASIFERFERAVATPHFGGFGLGLWLARRVVEAMGGYIRLESELGLGSTFTVELPLEGPA